MKLGAAIPTKAAFTRWSTFAITTNHHYTGLYMSRISLPSHEKFFSLFEVMSNVFLISLKNFLVSHIPTDGGVAPAPEGPYTR